MKHVWFTSFLLVASIVGVILVPIHASYMRTRKELEMKAILEVAPRLPAGDLALSGGARWLRFPSLEEPNAAFADAPAAPDPDPAGGMMAPPVVRGVLGEKGVAR